MGRALLDVDVRVEGALRDGQALADPLGAAAPDRVLVLDRGRISAEITGADITKDVLASAVYAEEAS